MTTADPFRIRSLSDADVAGLGPADLLDDERRCLGAAIIDNVTLDGPLSGLSRHHFSLPAHQELFTLMQEWRAAGLRFDLERLRQVLQQKKRLQTIGDFAYLQHLVHHGRQSLGNVSGNARLLIRKAAASGKQPATSKNQESPKILLPPTENRELGTENALITLAEVEAKPVDWIWEPYLPCGAVAVLSGDPGVGKSYLALAIAAKFSNKQQAASTQQEQETAAPMENREPRAENSSCNVLYVGGSDSAAQVLRPRFDALGGEAKRLYLLKASFQCPVSSFQPDGNAETERKPPQNRKLETGNRKLIPLLAAALRQTRARLVIVDPLETYLAAEGIGPHSRQFRRWLDQLAGLASEYHCCVLLVRTLSRSPSGRATAGALGSAELAGAVRSHLVAGASPDYPEERALVQVKANWGPRGPALGYTIDETGTFRWTGASTLTLEEMLAVTPDVEQKSALVEAERFLQATLARGAQPAATVQREAHNLGIAGVTLRRAKRRLGVVSKKRGAGPWEWEQPVVSGQWSVASESATSNKPQAASNRQESVGEAVASGQWSVASESAASTGELGTENFLPERALLRGSNAGVDL